MYRNGGNSIQRSNDPDRKYITIFKPSGSNDRWANYYKRSGENIIEDGANYYISIDTFDIPLSNIPLMLWELAPNYYLIEMEYNGIFSGAIPITYIPSYPSAPTTDPKYNYVFSYDIVLQMVNTTIGTAFAALAAATTLPTGVKQPYFQLQRPSLNMQYVAQSAFYDVMDPTTVPNPIKLYFNRPIYELFNGMDIYYDSSAVSRNAQFIAYNQYNNNETINGQNYYVMTTNKGAAATYGWNVAQGLLFDSDYLKTTPEVLPSAVKATSDLLNKRNVLATFDFVYTADEPIPCRAQYFLRSSPKLMDLMAGPIDVMDVKVLWRDKYNNTYPLDISFYKCFSIRFMFTRKTTQN